MHEQPFRQSGESVRLESEQVEALAGRVLSVLASRPPTDQAPSANGPVSDRLMAIMGESDDAVRDRAVTEMIESGVSIESLIDLHIPDVARQLGSNWCRDGMGFAEVTIGSARLQGLLRDLIRRSTPSHALDPMAPQVLMVVREDDHHTLGAMVATQQLRRIGVDVRVSIGQPDPEVLTLVSSRDFDLVMISSSAGNKLVTLAKFVEKIRNRACDAIPIVIGGTILGSVPDVVSETGANFATDSPEGALKRCGLKIPHHGARLLAPLS